MALLLLPQHSLLFLLLLLLPSLLLVLLVSSHPSVQQPLLYSEKISTADLAALAAIKTTLTDIPGSQFFSTWNLTSPDPCSTFSGITCSRDNRVTTLTLGTGLSDSPGLAGSLSPSISNLTELTQLVLFPGLVTGPIPPQLSQLTKLRVISLTNNRLTGPIPDSFSSLENLHTLDLSYNQLTGSIPPGLTGLPQLKVLVLASNSLTWELPDVTAQLLHLDLKKNKISGPLRSSSLPLEIRYVSLSDNSMWGPLVGLESLSELVYLDLSMNQFSGAIPSSLFNISTLSSMLLQRNNLSGTIPFPSVVDPASPSSSSYGGGSIVDLSHNSLTGQLSPILAGVESLFLNNNRLIGSVPVEYVKKLYDGSTRTLYLQHNYLTGFPLDTGLALPDTVSLCLSYNCMPPPIGMTTCPASAGELLPRPTPQCSLLKNGSSSVG